ncbi:MAG: glycosyltransferase family 2 protein [bacterium]
MKRNLPPETILAIVPAFNEAENLPAVLPRIPKKVCGRPLSVLVVNDGSTDDTSKVAGEFGAFVLDLSARRGGGAALRAGFEDAKKRGVEIVVTLDADGQHQPEEIETLVSPILEGEADLVIGSRLLGDYEKDSELRRVGIHFFNGLIRILSGIRVTDCSSGFRAFRLSELKKLHLVQDQYHTAEMILEAGKKGVRIVERPITVKRRWKGKSKKGNHLAYGFHFCRTLLKTWWR